MVGSDEAAVAQMGHTGQSNTNLMRFRTHFSTANKNTYLLALSRE